MLKSRQSKKVWGVKHALSSQISKTVLNHYLKTRNKYATGTIESIASSIDTSFFWPAYHNSWTIFNTVVCLSKHISKCHLNEILDKSVIICADKRWTSTLEQQSVQLSNNKWFHLIGFKFFSIYFNQSQCTAWQCWLPPCIVIGWTYQKPVLEKK